MAIDPASIEVLDVAQGDLKSVFPGEASAFTPWLARPENLARLSKAIGLDLEPIDTEVSTGVFRVDLLARNRDDDRLVVIENQFGRSDHDHLGKALTYLAATADGGEASARTVIWLAERFADEHRAVLAWLNNNTPEDVGFWGVIPRVLRIGEGPPGLRFEVVVRPNTLVKTVRNETGKRVDLSVLETRRLYWPILTAEIENDPELSGVVLRAGGGRGHMEIYPDERFREIPEHPYVLAYINLPVSGRHNARVYMRPSRETAPHWIKRIERIEKAVESAVSRSLSTQLEGVDFGSEESMRRIAADHLSLIKLWLHAIREEFAPEAAAVGDVLQV